MLSQSYVRWLDCRVVIMSGDGAYCNMSAKLFMQMMICRVDLKSNWRQSCRAIVPCGHGVLCKTWCRCIDDLEHEIQYSPSETQTPGTCLVCDSPFAFCSGTVYIGVTAVCALSSPEGYLLTPTVCRAGICSGIWTFLRTCQAVIFMSHTCVLMYMMRMLFPFVYID